VMNKNMIIGKFQRNSTPCELWHVFYRNNM
jgi:hypothetical protein